MKMIKRPVRIKVEDTENGNVSEGVDVFANIAAEEDTTQNTTDIDIAKLRRRYFKVKIPTNLEKEALKRWVLERLIENIVLFQSGTEILMPELFGPMWSGIPTGTKRQVSKEFKIAVAQGVIRGIIFLKTKSGGDKKRHASIVYRRL